EEADKNIKHALFCDQKAGVVYAVRGLWHQLQGHMDYAERDYNEALSLDEKLQAIQINLGDILYRKGKVSEAIIYWRRARELSPLPELAERRLMWKSVE
ncbi:MAG: tetratricopeptide repeat protein, partial [Patescibacteria group bacterium]